MTSNSELTPIKLLLKPLILIRSHRQLSNTKVNLWYFCETQKFSLNATSKLFFTI